MTGAEKPQLVQREGERPRFDGMLLIGAEDRNAGKTEFACAVIERFSRSFPVVGLKVTTIRGGGRPCPRGGAGCGACDLDQPYCITEEKNKGAGKDTARMLESGAGRVLWARCREKSLSACIAALRERIDPGALVVAESNSLAHVVDPGLFLMLRERGASGAKPSSRAVLRYADRIVLSDGVSFVPGPADLAVHEGCWQLLDASAVVLAGGASSRMGADKSLLDIGGVPLIEHVLAQLRGRFREVLISAEDPAPFRFAAERVIRDRRPGQGPLMGIAGALEAARTDIVFIVACDIPNIDPRVVRRLLAASRDADCVVPRRLDGKWEPLFSVWRRSALPAIRAVLSTATRKIDAVFPLLSLAVVEIGDAPWLRNLNTPADVAAYLAETGSITDARPLRTEASPPRKVR